MHMMSRRKKKGPRRDDGQRANQARYKASAHDPRAVSVHGKSGSARSWARSARGEKIHVGVNMERASYWMALVYARMPPVYSASDISCTAGPC